jgi:uncharacterized membrane protein
MKSKVNVNIDISFSKIVAILVLTIGSILTFYLEDGNVFITTSAVVSAMIIGKQFTDKNKPTIKEEQP